MKQPIVYLDLDGVLVNWVKSALELCGKDYMDPALSSTLHRDFDAVDNIVGWDVLAPKINGAGTDYWVNLEFLPWAHDLINRIKDQGRHIAFCTSPGRFYWAPSGKMMWRDKYFPGYDLVITKQKHYLAGPHAILVDDDKRQTDAFLQWGGHIVPWPNQYILRREGMDKAWDLLDITLDAQKEWWLNEVGRNVS